ncbi:histidinol-phosphate aminotransferase [Anaerosolibacter carboniphilus]|uniref:Histidinol-phosphate aminotransferase n=1 Tax=Anaerosolibacter carboniphilus TaxID=1417629 RepID=A0A841KPH0_9FIRM|nr:histidinol-phosphate transaminase [Anaerosolibacter carboniphilus]MBB6215674.1 histidinol-phosphate aminotransferase [Anaerosolibacter carboniphilus]
MKNLIKDSVRSIVPYSPNKNSYKIRLDANENPFNMLAEMHDEIVGVIGEMEMNRYPDTDSFCLRQDLAKYVGLKQENIICGNGSDEIIQVIIQTFVDKGDFVVTHVPTFSMYNIFTKIAGGEMIEVPSEEDFTVDVEKIIDTANQSKAKVIFLCNPNNPTGTTMSSKDILEVLQRTESMVVVDEAYYEFFGETMVSYVNDWDRLIVLRTLSKAFGLADIRLGYGVAGEDTIEILNRVRPPYNLSTFSQAMGSLALRNVDRVENYIQSIKAERIYMLNALQEEKEIIAFPSEGNFVLVKSDKLKEIADSCYEKEIGTRIFRNDSMLQNCMRISIGTRSENDCMIETIRKVVG